MVGSLLSILIFLCGKIKNRPVLGINKKGGEGVSSELANKSIFLVFSDKLKEAVGLGCFRM